MRTRREHPLEHKSAAAKKARHSASVRSHPPPPMNRTSRTLLGSGSFGGFDTPSMSNGEPSARMARRQLPRIFSAASSSQSWITRLKM